GSGVPALSLVTPYKFSYSPSTIAMSSGCHGTVNFASAVFRGHATDMNVHPTWDYFAIAPKT
ncbi:MAG: hypothetical protein DWI29_01570, partial [Planctomycetota bacterium]